MKIAVITQVFNEDFFLPIWLNHYGRLFGYANLFVIDDGSDDGSLNDWRIRNIIKKKRAPLDESERAQFVSKVHSELLKKYDIVIYTDCDELIVLDPQAGGDLRDFLGQLRVNCISFIGFNVLHDYGKEPDIDLKKPLFSQRHFLKFEWGYCKPLASRVPILWSPGFHKCNLATSTSRFLFLFHLRSIDYRNSVRRQKSLNSVSFSANAIKKNHSMHFRWDAETYLKHLYNEPNEGIPLASSLELADVFIQEMKVRNSSPPVVRVPGRFENTIELSGGHRR